MAVDKTKYKDISFFSGFSYLHQVHHGKVNSATNGFGSQEISTTIALPASVTQRPPFIEYYVEYPVGNMQTIQEGDGIFAGHDSNNIYISGMYNNAPTYTTAFAVHYVIYDRTV